LYLIVAAESNPVSSRETPRHHALKTERRISDAAQTASAKGERITGQAGEQGKRGAEPTEKHEQLSAL
jgi:hypothetical protein